VIPNLFSPWTGAYRGELASVTRNRFGAPMFEPKVFQKQMYCI